MTGGNNRLFVLWWIETLTLFRSLSLSLSFLFSLRWPSRCQAWPWVAEGRRQPLLASQGPLQLVGPRLHQRLPARPSALSYGSDELGGPEDEWGGGINGHMATKMSKFDPNPPISSQRPITNAQRGSVWLTPKHTFTTVTLKSQDDITLDGMREKRKTGSCCFSSLLDFPLPFWFALVVVVWRKRQKTNKQQNRQTRALLDR